MNKEMQCTIATLRAELPRLSREYGVKSLAVFGSRLRGDNGDESDLDVLVEFNEVPGFLRYIELEDDLSRTVGTRVDLVEKRSLRPAIGRHVLEEAVTL